MALGWHLLGPVLQAREPLGRLGRRGRLGHLRARGVGVERGDGHEQLPLALGDGDPAGGERPAVAHPLDDELDRLARRARLGEVGVQRLRVLVGDGGGRGQQRLGEGLAAEDPVEAARLGHHAEAVVADGLGIERREQPVERLEDRLLQRRVVLLELHGDMVTTAPVWNPLDRRVGQGGPAVRTSTTTGSPMPADQSRPTSARYPTSEQMMEVAVAATGLTDFGPGDFREGLDVLLESLATDAGLAPSHRRGRGRPAPDPAHQPAARRAVVPRPPRGRRRAGRGAGARHRAPPHRHHRPRQHALARPAVPQPAHVGAAQPGAAAGARRRARRPPPPGLRRRDRGAAARGPRHAPLRGRRQRGGQRRARHGLPRPAVHAAGLRLPPLVAGGRLHRVLRLPPPGGQAARLAAAARTAGSTRRPTTSSTSTRWWPPTPTPGS